MDSLSMYIGFCTKYSNMTADLTLVRVDELVACIYKEIMSPPYELKESTFIVEVFSLSKMLKAGSCSGIGKNQVSIVDAYVVIKSLLSYMNNQNFSATRSVKVKPYVHYIFKDSPFGSIQQNALDEINSCLIKIERIVQNMQKEHNMIDNNSEPKSYEYSELFEQTKDDVGNCFHSEQMHVSQKSDGTTSFYKKINAVNVQKWHEENSIIIRQLNEIQPVASSILEKIMNFSTEITEGYVLQFARMQVELFNLIADNYDYHVRVSNGSYINDYINAVNNYADFLDTIVDSLAVFGIEEIKSGAGTGFNGAIHEVVGNDRFSPKSALVNKSIRSGFRYKEIIIQKEKITI